MKKLARNWICICLLLVILISAVPLASGYEMGDPYNVDLSEWISNPSRCRYVQMMLDYYLRTDLTVQKALAEGYCSVFFFEGCSDNMDDRELSDLSYYRVSAVCVVVKLNESGEPEIIYFNDNCSTLPDRPLDYGAWQLEAVGDVGPATILDGTYELYSVKHAGKYEALHARTDYWDDTIPAVYMTPEGYTTARANAINIHTRTGNHILNYDMWSAGCMLVGDGEFYQFAGLMEATYFAIYQDYDNFQVDLRVGTVTVDRQFVKRQMYPLYKNREAVDTVLAASHWIQPQVYLDRCGEQQSYEDGKNLQVVEAATLMTLPCENEVDARSVALKEVSSEEILDVTGSIYNAEGDLWYQVNADGEICYIPDNCVTEPPEQLGWFAKLWKDIFS